MSIRLKLLLGCLCLTIVTLLVGVFSQHAQRQIGDLAIRIYDDALISTNALRAAQNAVLRLDATLKRDSVGADKPDPLTKAQFDHLTSELRAVVSELQIAREGAISPAGRQATQTVQRRLARIMTAGPAISPRFLVKEFATAGEELDAAVRVFAGDAYGVRSDVGAVIRFSIERTWGAIALAAFLALLISFLLARSIVPALRNAMAIAKSIASGNLDNRIVPNGRSETAELLTALSAMQESLARHFGEVENKAALEADRYDGELSTQNARFEAALNNMTQGLAMFDAKGRLVIGNLRFAEMFGPFEIGAAMQDLAREPRLKGLLTMSGEAFATREADGRMIAVSRQAIVSGGLVFTFEDVTERHRVAERLNYLANHDSLTDLANRMQLRDRLEKIGLEASAAKGTAVLCLDLDGFKFVNDTLGHPIGDVLLKAVGERLVAAAGQNDLVARIGGDEFAIVLTAQPQPGAAEDLARRVIAGFGTPFEIGHQKISIGVSIGIVVGVDALTAKGGGTWAHVLMKCADLALYEAKSRGRNTYCFFQPVMDERIQLRRSTEIDLSAALENDEFELYYQPFVNAARQTVSGFEALIRWRHPTRGRVPPAEFIPIAEEVGLIDRIGLWVLRTACRQAAGWPGHLCVSVNLSPVQFRSGTLAADVRAILIETGLDPQRLQLEVTESVLLSDTDAVLGVLGSLRRLGIRISMDDFGTGYSSLGYLSRFPFDKVKIDQSFVRDLGKRENLAVVRAVIGLSKAMGVAVIAEGVETREQRDILLAESCDEMQGYHFSEPRPVSDLPQFLIQFAAGARVEQAPRPGAAAAGA